MPPTDRAQYERISDDTRAKWDSIIDESIRHHETGSMSTDTYFADPALEEAIRASEADTREQFRQRMYMETQIWEMGQRAMRTFADQELAYSRVRFLERFGRPVSEQGESSHQAHRRFVAEEGTAAHELFGASSQDPVAPTQRTIAERVIQAPRTRTQRGPYYELDSDSDSD